VPHAEGKAERHVLLDVMATPINDAVEPLLRRAQPSLALFDRASEAPVCDWPVPAKKPLAAAEAPRVYGIDDIVILRARFRAARRDAAGALEDCRRLALLGRRVEQRKSTASYAIGTHFYNKAILTADPHRRHHRTGGAEGAVR
jgi:hypothetical protein